MNSPTHSPATRIRVQIDRGTVTPGSVLWHVLEAIRLGIPQVLVESVAHYAKVAIEPTNVAVQTHGYEQTSLPARDFQIRVYLPPDLQGTKAGNSIDRELGGAMQRVLRTMSCLLPRTPYFLVETAFDAILPPLSDGSR